MPDFGQADDRPTLFPATKPSGAPRQEAPTVEVAAEVDGVTFFSEDTNYLIARVRIPDEPGLTTIVGSMPRVSPGETLTLTGSFVMHPRYGRQFEVSAFRQELPATLNGIRRYLASGAVTGVGEVLAGRLIAAFGEKVLDILENEPEKFLGVEGMGRKKLERVLSSWREQREIRSLMLFLQSNEIATTYAAKIFKLHGASAVQKIQANPYDLAYEIRGIGFAKADAMALRLGFDPLGRERVEAAMVYCLFQQGEQGHLFYPRAALFERVSQMLGGAPEDCLDDALAGLEEKKRVKVQDLPEQDIEAAVYLRHFYVFEKDIADRLRLLAAHPAADLSRKGRDVLPGIEADSRLRLSPEQREAVLGALDHKVFILTGGPGTGKTTITRMAVAAFRQLDLKVRLAAPTGRAAKRLSEATGHPASTLHRLLQYAPDGSFAVNEGNKLKTDVLVVDEASMLDAKLCVSLLRALPLTSRLCLVGDVDQLPSVGPGNVLGDIISSEVVPTVRLTHIFRQAGQSMIVVNAHRINQGQFPLASPKSPPEADFFWVEQDDPAEVRDRIVELVGERIPRAYGLDPMADIQVLSPMHKGEAGTQSLNEALRARLNPSGPEIGLGRRLLRLGDRVLQTRNDYDKDVYNGDLGRITAVDPEAGELVVDFDGRAVSYDRTDRDDLAPAYAVSVHKSQGSEYPAVVVPILTQHYLMLRRNLIYTALTRAKRLAILIGGRRAMALGLRNVGSDRRYTHLSFRLRERFND